MNHLLAAEWVKLRHRLMPRILIVIALGLVALIAWGTSYSDNRIDVIAPRAWIVGLMYTGYFAAFIWPILGGGWAGSEYSWGTVRMILSRRPSRTVFVASGLVALLLTALVTLILVLVVATISGLVVSALTRSPAFATAGLQSGYLAIVIQMFLASFYVIAFYLVLSYTFGTIFRSSSVGIGIGIGITVAQLIAIGILDRFGGFWHTAADHFPTIYLNTLIARVSAEGTTPSFASGSSGPDVPECLLGIGVYIAVLLLATLYIVNRRDVTS